jgi:chaperonin GroEL
MNKLIYKTDDIKDKIREAVNLIADPVRQTLSPKGNNVLYEDDRGDQYVTNDGVTIAKNIKVSDPITNAIIEVIKQPALQTNSIAGDGTTTSILLSSVLIKEGLKEIDNGMNRMVLKEKLQAMGAKIKNNLSKKSIKIHNPQDIFKIAKISANNDEEIAKDVSKIIEVVGQDGMVFLEPHHKKETDLIFDTGFSIDTSIYKELAMNKGFSFNYENIPTFITDKRLYYKEEAETILSVAIENGWPSVAIVARDFLDKARNFFISNHVHNVINVVLVQDPQCTEKDSSSLADLATYLGGKLYSEKHGQLVNKLKSTDFVVTKKIVGNPTKTILVTSKPDNKEVKERIKSIKEELKKVKGDKSLEKRLASLTNGTATVKVGGSTPLEIQEKLFRYEDAVNAARAAMKDGYLVGGGLALLSSFVEDEHKDLKQIARRFCEASVRQIAENCGKHPETVLENTIADKNIGYNARSDKYENLLNNGIIDPYKVTEMAVDNSISVASYLLTSGYLIVNDIESYEKERNKEN